MTRAYPLSRAIEDLFPYTVSPKISAGKRRKMEREARVAREGWRLSDGDHQIGREKQFMNGLLYVLACSHSLNSCRNQSRKHAGEWLFIWTYIPYTGGNPLGSDGADSDTDSKSESSCCTWVAEDGADSDTDSKPAAKRRRATLPYAKMADGATLL